MLADYRQIINETGTAIEDIWPSLFLFVLKEIVVVGMFGLCEKTWTDTVGKTPIEINLCLILHILPEFRFQVHCRYFHCTAW